VHKTSQASGSCSRSTPFGKAITEHTGTTSGLHFSRAARGSDATTDSKEGMDVAITSTSMLWTKNKSSILSYGTQVTLSSRPGFSWLLLEVANTWFAFENSLTRNLPKFPNPRMAIFRRGTRVCTASFDACDPYSASALQRPSVSAPWAG